MCHYILTAGPFSPLLQRYLSVCFDALHHHYSIKESTGLIHFDDKDLKVRRQEFGLEKDPVTDALFGLFVAASEALDSP